MLNGKIMLNSFRKYTKLINIKNRILQFIITEIIQIFMYLYTSEQMNTLKINNQNRFFGLKTKEIEGRVQNLMKVKIYYTTLESDM